ncbi:proton-translocating NADH-quinone oxidoreductase, chain M [Haloterrigena turkmenica DSM 5511]|uniref:Proton-translocating NADH-quinone oxidoreductase, chain M n=1 Tax=Haloterrigena turkmenica (strain ATCC 51198 / DSM 5511 / JCM 9101 / NCIMB 13204 / VKM B-1734 / 4k) TaxID=543526 RepID=D2RZ76_HALTV|nr:NuoM family protein [Haloterrigena turkmenica]ADB60000.1 proton-translocating NADH-quinone oxidoreductase, chain M [Haloterrigena turkmenica DSM 5511]
MMIEALIAVALIGALVTFVAPNRVAGKLAFAISLVPAALSLWMFTAFDGSGNALLDGELAFESHLEWIQFGDYSIEWFVGLDGISLPLVVMTTILCTLAILSSWTPIDSRESQFYGLVLFIEANLIGVFSALDFFVWFIFWEAVLIPMYLLIGVWGGPDRKYAAIKFFVYTNVASLVMFGSFIALVFGLGDAATSFALPDIADAMVNGGGVQSSVFGIDPGTFTALVFIAMFLGFAVKVPVVPFHTWLPDAHVQAPTPASVLLAGVLLKMGTYALLRFNFTMFPEQVATYAVPIAAIAVISVIYGAMLALAQTDLKRIVAYSSVSSMGYVILGLIAYTQFGVGGATFQMVSHGLISGLMFMSVGVIYNVTHTRSVEEMSGLADRMPIAVGILVAGAFGYMGLPLMSGFHGEFTIFFGAFQADFAYAPLFTALAMFGIVIVAGYLLFALQRTVFGPYHLETDYDVGRAPLHDIAPMFVLLALIIALGVAPELIFDMITDAVDPILNGGDL